MARRRRAPVDADDRRAGRQRQEARRERRGEALQPQVVPDAAGHERQQRQEGQPPGSRSRPAHRQAYVPDTVPVLGPGATAGRHDRHPEVLREPAGHLADDRGGAAPAAVPGVVVDGHDHMRRHLTSALGASARRAPGLGARAPRAPGFGGALRAPAPSAPARAPAVLLLRLARGPLPHRVEDLLQGGGGEERRGPRAIEARHPRQPYGPGPVAVPPGGRNGGGLPPAAPGRRLERGLHEERQAVPLRDPAEGTRGHRGAGWVETRQTVERPAVGQDHGLPAARPRGGRHQGDRDPARRLGGVQGRVGTAEQGSPALGIRSPPCPPLTRFPRIPHPWWNREPAAQEAAVALRGDDRDAPLAQQRGEPADQRGRARAVRTGHGDEDGVPGACHDTRRLTTTRAACRPRRGPPWAGTDGPGDSAGPSDPAGLPEPARRGACVLTVRARRRRAAPRGLHARQRGAVTAARSRSDVRRAGWGSGGAGCGRLDGAGPRRGPVGHPPQGMRSGCRRHAVDVE
ncbi:hypothetical protein SNARM312S_03059 [Streptomyces narbonensis]